jgi:hypothetical protein
MKFAKPHMTLAFSSAAVVATVASVAPSDASAFPYQDPWWTPNVVTGLPPVLYPAGWYGAGFGAFYGAPAVRPGIIYLCRASGFYGSPWMLHFGHVYGGACHYPWAGRGYSTGAFDYLAGGFAFGWYRSGYHEWSAPAQEDALGLSQVCRAEVNAGAVTGQIVDGNCHVAFEGVEVIRSDYEILKRAE